MRQPRCSRCRNHDKTAVLKGHKRHCPYQECVCSKCSLIYERKQVMNLQNQLKRGQAHDEVISLVRQNIQHGDTISSPTDSQPTRAAVGSQPPKLTLTTVYKPPKQQVQQSINTLLSVLQLPTKCTPLILAILQQNSFNMMETAEKIMKAEEEVKNMYPSQTATFSYMSNYQSSTAAASLCSSRTCLPSYYSYWLNNSHDSLIASSLSTFHLQEQGRHIPPPPPLAPSVRTSLYKDQTFSNELGNPHM